MVRSTMATAPVTAATWREGSVYSITAAKRRTERLPSRATISRSPVRKSAKRLPWRATIARVSMQKSAKRRMAAAISSKAKKISRRGKHVEYKTRIQKNDEVDSWKDDRAPAYHPDSPEYHPDSPEYHPDSDQETLLYIQHSPATEQRLIEKEERGYMVRANQALVYYHEKYPDDLYEPVHVSIEQVRQIIDEEGYYIHMNFTAKNIKTRAEKIFFAELFLSADISVKDYVVTACGITGPESVGGLRHIYLPSTILFIGNAMDMENCYACDGSVKHLEGSTYQAGHRGHSAYL